MHVKRLSYNDLRRIHGCRVSAAARARLFHGPLDFVLRLGVADKKLLARAGAEGDALPPVLDRHRDAHLHRSARVANRTDHPGNDGADLGVLGQHALQDLAHAVDDAVLDLEPVLGRAQPHQCPPRSGAMNRLMKFVSKLPAWKSGSATMRWCSGMEV